MVEKVNDSTPLIKQCFLDGKESEIEVKLGFLSSVHMPLQSPTITLEKSIK